jgi:hypothetical protein
LELLTHLQDTYGTIHDEHLQANLEMLNREWSPNQPIQDVWITIKNARHFAANTQEPIVEATATRSALATFQNSGVFTEACREWRIKPVADQTFDNIMAHFNNANVERKRTATTTTAGFHQANSAATTTPITPAPPDQNFGYCWTHGVTLNGTHTSATCKNPNPGHCRDATLRNLKGGNDRIQQRRARPATPPASNTTTE